MESLFVRVLTLSLTGSAVLLPLLLLAPRLRGRYAAGTLSVLWLVLALRMALPVPLSLPWTAVTVDVSALSSVTLPAAPRAPAEVPEPAGPESVEPPRAVPPAAAPEGRPLPLLELAAWVWLAGGLALVGYQGAAYLLARRRLLRGAQPGTEEERAQLAALAAELGLRRTPRLLRTGEADAPLVVGLGRPVLLLPGRPLPADEREVVLLHELTHLRRHDLAHKALLFVPCAVHWFNPLVWVMLVLANRDLELSCDAAVVRLYGAEARAPYARTLLELEARRSRFLPLCSAFNKNALEERIGAIMRSRKTSAAALAVALVLVVALTAVLATNAPRERPIASASGLTIRDNGVVTAYQEGVWDSSGELKPDPQTGHYYTKEQYEQVAALKTEGYESLSIAEFNRTLYAALNESEALSEAFGRVLMDLPETDPLAPFLVNTAQPSLNEYNARLNEVYSGRAEDPSFSGQLSRTETANVYGDTVEVGWTEAGYSFTYRILDQDGLTVAERDAFLQSILKGMQDCLDDLSTESLRDEGKLKQTLQAELDRLGAAAATGQIAYTGGAVEGCWSEAAYDGSGTLVTHDLVVEGMA